MWYDYLILQILKRITQNRKKAARKTCLPHYLKTKKMYLLLFTIGRQYSWSGSLFMALQT